MSQKTPDLQVGATRGLLSRVRTGCYTCKRRKVKCDEARPYCLRCQKGGYVCNGYRDTSPVRGGQHLTVRPSLMTGLTFLSADEYQYVNFYLESSKLTSPFETTFWTRYVPQISHSDPAVRHALVAISAYSRGANTCLTHPATGQMLDDQRTAFSHYHRAIRALQERMSNSDEDNVRVVLITCLLLTLLECQMGNYDTGAVTHLMSGLEILGNLRAKRTHGQVAQDQSSDAAIIEEQLVHIFAFLELQAAFVVQARADADLGKRRRERLHLAQTPLSELNNLSDAKHLLENLLSHIFDHHQVTEEVKGSRGNLRSPEILARYEELSVLLENWSDRFRRFLLTAQSDFNPDELHSAVQLKITEKFASLMLKSSILKSEEMSQLNTEHDSLLKMVRSFVEARTARMGAHERATGQHQVHFGWSLGGGIVPPLAFTANCCAKLSLRWQAVEMLTATKAREGFWDGNILSSVGRAALLLDEAKPQPDSDGDSDSWVSDGPRTLFLEGASSEDRMGTLEVRTVRGDDAVVVTEMIRW